LAIADFDAALRLDAGLTAVYRERAAAYISSGKHEQARADLASFLKSGGTPDANYDHLCQLAQGVRD
jgi:hypothetical protein